MSCTALEMRQLLTVAYSQTWDSMESQFVHSFGLELSDCFPAIAQRFVGSPRDAERDLDNLLLELYPTDEDDDADDCRLDDHFCAESIAPQNGLESAINRFLSNVVPKSKYNLEILRHFVDGWHCMQTSRDAIEHDEVLDAVSFMSMASWCFGATRATSSWRDANRQMASKAGRKRHERSPETKKRIVEMLHKHIDPATPASQAALQLYMKGVPFHIEGIARVIRAERKQKQGLER